MADYIPIMLSIGGLPKSCFVIDAFVVDYHARRNVDSELDEQ